MKSSHKIMKAKKRRKDYEKKRNIIRNTPKKATIDKKTKTLRKSNPRVVLPRKRKYSPPKTPLL